MADYAIWSAGAVTVPISETSSAEQVEWILGDSGARALIVETPAHLQANSEVLSRLPGVERIWLIEGPDAEGQAAQLDSLAADGAGVSDEELAGRRASRQAADLATIIYTSGTTGRPKGCELSHVNLLADVRNAIGGLPGIFAQPGRSALLFLPLAHSFARIIQIGCLESGTVLGYTADVAHLVEDLGTFQPTFILAVPRVFEKVYNGAEQQAAASGAKSRIFKVAAQSAVAWSRTLDQAGQPVPGQQNLRLRAEHALYDRLVYAKLRAATGGRVQYAVSGGAALGERLGHFFRGVGITVLEGYGLTETSPVISVNRPDHNKIGTVGPPIPSVTVRIADDGEILASGPNVFAGYWHNEAATKEMVDPDGWLHTGDLGELDEDGYLRVTGRKKDIIVTAGGKNVAPAVLEDRLRAHPLVSQCMVVGDGRPFVACLVTLDEEALGPWQARHPNLAGASLAELAAGAGADRRDPVGRGRGQQGGVPGRVDPQVHRAPGRLHRAERLPDAVAQGAPGRGGQGLRRRHRRALQLTAPCWAPTSRTRPETSSSARWTTSPSRRAGRPGDAILVSNAMECWHQRRRICSSRWATRSQRHSRSTQASPFSPMARRPPDRPAAGRSGRPRRPRRGRAPRSRSRHEARVRRAAESPAITGSPVADASR